MENCLELPEAIEYSLLKKVRLPIILNLLMARDTDVILDVGSGGGYFTKILAEKSNFVIGLDKSFINAKNAKRSMNNEKASDFVVGDATRLPFKKKVLDKILATEIIEHIENDTLFIEECERTLKDKGSILITAPCTNPTFSLNWLTRLSGVNIETDFGHVRKGYARKEMETLLSSKNLRIIKVGYFSQFFSELSMILTYIGRTAHSGGNKWTDGKTQSNLIVTKTFKLYKFIFPILFQFSKLDKLLDNFKGHHIIIKASKKIK